MENNKNLSAEYFMVSDDTAKEVMNKLEEKGCIPINIRLLSIHPDDNYLYVVLAFIIRKNEFVVWLYNSDGGFFVEGSYFNYDDYKKAIEKFYTKR